MTGVWLGIETTTATGGVALVKNGVLLAEECFPVRATHSEKVLPGVARLLKQAEVMSEEIAGIANTLSLNAFRLSAGVERLTLARSN